MVIMPKNKFASPRYRLVVRIANKQVRLYLARSLRHGRTARPVTRTISLAPCADVDPPRVAWQVTCQIVHSKIQGDFVSSHHLLPGTTARLFAPQLGTPMAAATRTWRGSRVSSHAVTFHSLLR